MNNSRIHAPSMAAMTMLALLCGAVAGKDKAEAPKNVLPNPGFEEVSNGSPAGWAPQSWYGKAVQKLSDGGRSGKHCVMIQADKGVDLAWRQIVKVKPMSKYRLSGWVKTKDVKPVESRKGMGAMFNLHGSNLRRTKGIIGTNDWTRLELVFETEYEEYEVQVNCLFGGWGLATGTA